MFSSGLQQVFFFVLFFVKGAVLDSNVSHAKRYSGDYLILRYQSPFLISHYNIIVYNGTSFLDGDYLAKSENWYGQSLDTHRALCFSCLANQSFN